MAFKRDDDELAEGGMALCAALRALAPATGETCDLISKAETHFQAVLKRGKKPATAAKPAAEKKGQ